MMRVLFLLRIVLIFILITSCAGFNNAKLKKNLNKVYKDTISEVSGIYKCNPSKFYNFHYGKLAINNVQSQQHTLDRMLMNQPFNNEPLNALDLLEQSRDITVNIEVNQKEQILHITDFHNKSSRFTATIPFIMKNGFLYLDNKNVKRKGVPFIYHTTSKSQVRIGLSKDNNLLVQRYSESHGSIFIMSSGSSSDTVYEFERISQ